MRQAWGNVLKECVPLFQPTTVAFFVQVGIESRLILSSHATVITGLNDERERLPRVWEIHL